MPALHSDGVHSAKQKPVIGAKISRLLGQSGAEERDVESRGDGSHLSEDGKTAYSVLVDSGEATQVVVSAQHLLDNGEEALYFGRLEDLEAGIELSSALVAEEEHCLPRDEFLELYVFLKTGLKVLNSSEVII